MTPLSETDSSVSGHDPEATDEATKKRGRPRQTNEDIIRSLAGTTDTRPRGRPRVANKAPLNATHEIRRLRAQVASMEEELNNLQSKWTEQLPDARMLAIAQRTAYEKHEVDQTEDAHNELQGILAQQQLTFAALQSALLRAPLQSTGKDILKALHFDTHLGRDPEDRERELVAHHKRSTATLPSVVRRIAQVAVDKVLAHREEVDINKPVTPLSQIDITGCKDHTLISSVFISEIPNTSLEKVYRSVQRYFDDIPNWMKHHFGIDAKRTRLNDAESPANYWRLTLEGNGIPARVNHVLCSELTPSHGVFHVDSITDDPLHSVSSIDLMQYGLCGITITPHKEPATGEVVSVTLRWLVVYRYNLLPDDPTIREELEIIRPILNGDLISSAVCRYLQET